MRVMLVALPEDPRVAQHVDLLRSAGWSVTLVSPRPGAVDGSRYPSLRVHQPPRPEPSGSEKTDWPFPVQRLRLAAARVSYRAADELRTLTGLDLEPGPFALRPFDQSGTPRESIDTLLHAFGLWPAPDATWLAGLIQRLQPNVITSVGVRDGIALTFAARTRARIAPPWLLMLAGEYEGAWEQPGLAKQMRHAFGAASAVLAEQPEQLDLARRWGFTGTTHLVAPIGGGWPLAHCRTLQQPGPTSGRRTIAVSGVQNAAGRAFVALRGIELAADALHPFQIDIFAANEDVSLSAELLQGRTGLAITTRSHLSDEDRWRLLGRARCTLALSDSTTTAPALMQAAVMRSFPIGSATDHDRTWLQEEQTALLVWPEDPDAVAAALRRAVSDDQLIDAGVAANERAASVRFDREVIGNEILSLYRRISRVTGDG
jgi:hypothetical protein